ncbi:MAG: Short-chain dehydrogenases of various substrate specificities [uncultured Craurococcus sp.]|uniref:NADP-dependent 3-hydroxy acid dehydrogenase YdfG n=1 Tax=uncultured Craurococcus sp. TaxID=1135998 RepID=A0A6J4JNZ8_9PROT|nr:MAG: Short-chain dehydrogenases of various substrate specificities [uncultured Craurococcus sp.]
MHELRATPSKEWTQVSKSQIPGTALVTGASGGIGALYADRLARRGHDLVLVARDRARLDRLARRLVAETGRQVRVLAADLADPAGTAAVEQVLQDDASLTMLVNNAGVGATAPLLASDVGAMSRMIALNVDAPMRLTYAAVPRFVARSHGTVVNIASVVAVAPELLNGVYGGTKAFVLAFSQSLRHELAGTGVGVQVVLPGATATEFWSVAGTPLEHLPREMVMRAEDLVDAALAGLDAGEFATVPSLPDPADWAAFEAARLALRPGLSRTVPASRYGLAA